MLLLPKNRVSFQYIATLFSCDFRTMTGAKTSSSLQEKIS